MPAKRTLVMSGGLNTALVIVHAISTASLVRVSPPYLEAADEFDPLHPLPLRLGEFSELHRGAIGEQDGLRSGFLVAHRSIALEGPGVDPRE
jgi:hypothetical protein